MPLLAVLGCAGAQGGWQQARTLDTVSGYEEFLAAHPQSAFSDSAERRVEQLDWDSARQDSTFWSYRKFLTKHPQSAFAKLATTAMAELRICRFYEGAPLPRERVAIVQLSGTTVPCPGYESPGLNATIDAIDSRGKLHAEAVECLPGRHAVSVRLTGLLAGASPGRMALNMQHVVLTFQAEAGVTYGVGVSSECQSVAIVERGLKTE
jgi:hypothetical protein